MLQLLKMFIALLVYCKRYKTDISTLIGWSNEMFFTVNSVKPKMLLLYFLRLISGNHSCYLFLTVNVTEFLFTVWHEVII